MTTAFFSTSASAYSRCLALLWLGRWWWAIALPVAPLLVWGCYDLRLLIVAAAILLLMWPGILMIVFFYYALTPWARKALFDRRITIADSGDIAIEYRARDDSSVRPPDETIAAADVSDIEDLGSSVLITLRGPGLRFIEIPAGAIVKESEGVADSKVESQ